MFVSSRCIGFCVDGDKVKGTAKLIEGLLNCHCFALDANYRKISAVSNNYSLLRVSKIIMIFWILVSLFQLRISRDNLILLQRTVNKELKKARICLDINKLSMNIDKTIFTMLKSPLHSSSEIIIIKVGKDLPCKIYWSSFGLTSFTEVSSH